MLLNDIGNDPSSTLKKINQHLESNYGFKITEDINEQDLVSIMETIQEEISDLKMRGDDSKASPEISKRLLILEGLRSMQEGFTMMSFQSPKLDYVVNCLKDYVVDYFHKAGMGMSDFNKAVAEAMSEYRSSKYRFPDNVIEQRVRQAALEGCVAPAETAVAETGAVEVENLPLVDNDEDLKLERMGLQKALAENKKPANVDKQKTKGITMKEHKNLVKNLRRLLETEVSQAEVMMAAKGFAQELQEMVEKIGRLQNEDLPPVTDQMRETYGMDSASAFQTQIYGALQGVMDALYTAKNQVDDAVSNMASTGQVGAAVDMDKPVDMGSDIGADMGAEEPAELDLDNIGDELAGDEFGGAEEEEQLGREMKEAAVLKKKIAEMKKIVAKARKLKEASK